MEMKRMLWLSGSEHAIACRVFIRYASQWNKFAAHVLTDDCMRGFVADTPEEVEACARRFVEETWGPIRRDHLEYAGAPIRIARWGGTPVLVRNGQGIALLEEWVSRVAEFSNERQVRGFFERQVLPQLSASHRLILHEWLSTDQWSDVWLDAFFASLQPDIDYTPA